MALNKLDCWWIAKSFEQKKEIVCGYYSECYECPLTELCIKNESRKNITEKDVEIEEVFKNAENNN